ncbi:guanylate kinase [Gimesia maris]|uniref:Guanylate kinase n=1 Tax=Gimesia maris TaxID=122 RepID=A0ABX5YKP7_9PLAN|nr:guanylate kinase [Gimesia maris]HAW29500.1 guanylate kinase [Planctomycetaceae bacterium]EDL56835.1 guanylate kinase [Gimesia maris DSM 8797]QDT78714.1 Guanylate kinase [Gimesia maris]QEG16227.1 Guanylate kinase [Gimesia maris]QGQ30561.1 guanylate kinase [Gimesia maris]
MSEPQACIPPDIPIVVLSGPTASGKTTIVNRLMQETPVKLIKAISATTRPRRKGEVDGKDYYFLTTEEFEKRQENNEFLECEQVHGLGYWYGTLKSEVDRAAKQGGWPFLEIDVQGTLKLKKQFPQTITLFVRTSSDEEYEKRIRNRGTESEEVIEKRLATIRKELEQAQYYSHVIINDDLERAVTEIGTILKQRELEINAGRI